MRNIHSFCQQCEYNIETNTYSSCGKLKEDCNCKEHLDNIEYFNKIKLKFKKHINLLLERLSLIQNIDNKIIPLVNMFEIMVNNPILCCNDNYNKFCTFIYRLDTNISYLKKINNDKYMLFINIKNRIFKIHDIDVFDLCKYYLYLKENNLLSSIDIEILDEYNSIYDHYNYDAKHSLKFVD